MNYFAFGSNLDLDQMRERVGFSGVPDKGSLRGYQLVFNKYSMKRACGAGNIVYTGNNSDRVEGIVYALSQSQLSQLDQCEGVDSSQSSIPSYKGYQRKLIQLVNRTEVYTYIAFNGDNNLKPSIHYLKHFLKGKHYLSVNYYQQLLVVEVMEGGILKDYLSKEDNFNHSLEDMLIVD